jgi:Zn-dependent protease with chaperone function
MGQTANRSNYYFWLLMLATLILTGLGLVLIARNGSPGWVRDLWHACRSGLQYLGQHLPTTWRGVLLILLAVVIGRGSWSLGHQLRRTRQLTDLFHPLRETPPSRLIALLEVHGLRADDLVYLNLATPHAFCLGLRRPRIWLTAGLVKLLSDKELAAVVAHEAYHRRQRDPLRLVISRASRAAFFFLPLMGELARATELQQEVAADQFAIQHLSDDLPLLCALQKLLTCSPKEATLAGVAYNPFNVTEARLRRLIYPSQPMALNWRRALTRWAVNLGAVVVLAGIGLLSTQPVVEHGEIGTCAIDKVATPVQIQFSWPEIAP